MNAKLEVSRTMASDLLAARQRKNQRKALEELRRHLGHAIGEMSLAAQRPEIYTADFGKLVERFGRLDKIAADALDDSGILDATTREEAGRIADENQRLRLLVLATLVLERRDPGLTAEERAADRHAWVRAARAMLARTDAPVGETVQSLIDAAEQPESAKERAT